MTAKTVAAVKLSATATPDQFRPVLTDLAQFRTGGTLKSATEITLAMVDAATGQTELFNELLSGYVHNSVDYVVMSGETPIAWHRKGSDWAYNHARDLTPTNERHMQTVHDALAAN